MIKKSLEKLLFTIVILSEIIGCDSLWMVIKGKIKFFKNSPDLLRTVFFF